MRELADPKRIEAFMQAFGRMARERTKVYLTGGATAVLVGWRNSTVDVDLKFDPERDELFRALRVLKEELQINVELAAPSDFIPELPGWKERSVHIDTFGKTEFYHYDFYSQALSKIERGHRQDVSDVEAMIELGIVEPGELMRLFQEIKPNLYKYPAINPSEFESAIRDFTSR